MKTDKQQVVICRFNDMIHLVDTSGTFITEASDKIDAIFKATANDTVVMDETSEESKTVVEKYKATVAK